MFRNPLPFIFILGALLFFMAACQKDELTVVSLEPPSPCGVRTILVNVDSLIQANNGGNTPIPEQHYTFCSCDTVRLEPANVQSPWYFERWFFGIIPWETDYLEPILDTITTGTHVTLDIHSTSGGPEPSHVHIRLDLHEEDC